MGEGGVSTEGITINADNLQTKPDPFKEPTSGQKANGTSHENPHAELERLASRHSSEDLQKIEEDKKDVTTNEQSETTEIVERKLQPLQEEDDGGFIRRIFTVNNVTFSFRGREEAPSYPTLNESNNEILGENPNWLDDERYQRYKRAVENSDGSEQPQHYQVTKTPLGVVELALKLGSNQAALYEMKQELLQRRYTPKTLDLIDKLIAANYVADDYASFNTHANPYGEALVVLSLLGDQEADAAVTKKVQALKELYPVSIFQDQPDHFKNYGSLDPKELVAVHATKYEPKIGVSGAYVVPDTFDATNGQALRNTIHTSLNHKVQANDGGSWDSASYVLISPFEHMVQVNGIPGVINTVDTWWIRNPGEPLYFGQANLVAPDATGQTQLIRIDGNRRYYKTVDLDRADLINLVGKSSQSRDSFNYTLDELARSICYASTEYPTTPENWDIDQLSNALTTFLYKEDHWPYTTTSTTTEFADFVLDGENAEELKDKFQELLISSGVMQAVKESVEDKNKALEDLAETMANGLKTKLQQWIVDYTVAETIKERGFAVRKGGNRAWDDDDNVIGVQQNNLAREYGLYSDTHAASPQDTMTETQKRLNKMLDDEGKYTNWKNYDDSEFDALIPQLDPKSLRVLYASGLLTARG